MLTPPARRSASSLEILESRIAPAIFFLSGKTDTVVNASGTSVNDATANSAAGSTVAVDLHTGDVLVYDANGNHKLDKGETILVRMTAGSGIAFFSESNGDVAFEQRDSPASR